MLLKFIMISTVISIVPFCAYCCNNDYSNELN